MQLRGKILSLIFALLSLFGAYDLHAQYYSWGADPARFKWMVAKGDKSTVIYPQHASRIGLTTHYFAERMKPYVSYGLQLPPLDLPFVVHPENMRSNGLVMWLPKRIEFLSTPSIDGYSMPWIKQLVAHEYRHAAQYNNLNVGVVKFLSYLLGEQSSTVGLIFLPLWMMEGDATMCETQASTFGRALQPSFTLEYRAMGDITQRYRNIDKLFCGSYRDFIPDHYQLGYQLVAQGDEMAGEVMTDKMGAFRARRPWYIISTGMTMKKLFGFNINTLFDSTFNTLTKHWASIPQVDNSSRLLPAPKITSYTTYSNPIAIGEELLITKRDLDKPSRFVALDPKTGHERTLSFTGNISTRPAYDKVNNRIWWTEYRRSTMFEEKVLSTLCYMDLDRLKPRTQPMQKRNILYPTPDNEGGLAWAEYAADGHYSFHHRTCDGKELDVELPFGLEIHSLAWDNLTDLHYCIITSDKGMAICSIDSEGKLSHITQPAYITLSRLRAKDGKLYFGSIASGKDEVHYINLSSRKEYQISESTYGSFDPAPMEDGMVAMTTYDSMGYHPAVQHIDKTIREIGYSPTPLNLVNPPRKSWGIINLDTVSIAQSESTLNASPRKVRRYRKGLTLFNFHSWAPLSYNPFQLSEDSSISLNAGATIMTQNLLSSMQGFFSYGYNRHNGSIWKGELRYYGLGPTISVNATYGGHQNIYPIYTYDPEKHEINLPEAPHTGKYYSFGVNISLPLMFERGYHTRYLIASSGWDYSNGLVANTGKFKIDESGISNIATIGYKKGIHLTQFALAFQDFVKLSHRDFAPRWGVVSSVNYAMNPANEGFSDLISLYAKLYTPGIFAHNSLSLALAYQTSIGGFKSSDALSALRFKATRLLPRGFDSTQIENRNYIAGSINYQFPFWYPDGGWQGIIYFKRLRANLGFDYAQFEKAFFRQDGKLYHQLHRINSWGADLIVDCNLLSQPAAGTTALKFSVYRPNEGGIFFSVGMELPF